MLRGRPKMETVEGLGFDVLSITLVEDVLGAQHWILTSSQGVSLKVTQTGSSKEEIWRILVRCLSMKAAPGWPS